MVAFPDGISGDEAEELVGTSHPGLSQFGGNFMELVNQNIQNWKKQKEAQNAQSADDTPETIVLRTLQWILQSGQAVSAEAMGDVIVNDLRVAGWLPPLED